jgi:hypothetical protein
MGTRGHGELAAPTTAREWGLGAKGTKRASGAPGAPGAEEMGRWGENN